MEYLSESTRKKGVILILAIFCGAVYLTLNPDVVSMKTFVDDNNLHAMNIRETVSTEVLQKAQEMFNEFISSRNKTEKLIEIMGRMRYDTSVYSDQYNLTGVLSVLRPRRSEDRSCILVVGRYSTNPNSTLNPQSFPSLNTLSSVFALASELEKQVWISRNVLFALLDDTTKIGINDFITNYIKTPICGRIIAGLELDIEPSLYGATELHTVISGTPKPNQDIVNGYVHNMKYLYRNMDIITPFSKYAPSFLQSLLLEASTIRYTDTYNGPLHDIDVLQIQTTFNASKVSTSVPHKYLVSSYLSLIRSFNNLYQQLQYSTYFYIFTDVQKYLPFPVCIGLCVAFLSPLLFTVLASVIPQAVYYILKPKETGKDGELIVSKDAELTEKTEISHPRISLFFFFSLVSVGLFVAYLCVFGWHEVSIEDKYTFESFTDIEKSTLVIIGVVPVLLPVIFSFFSTHDLAQLRLNLSFSSLLPVFYIAVEVYLNQPLALVTAACTGIASIVPVVVLFYKKRMTKVGKVWSAATSLIGASVILYETYADVSILAFTPMMAFTGIVVYTPFSMSLIYVMFCFDKLEKSTTGEENKEKVD
ncbi:hypothetical protein EIN_026790 [Entamoeba invadens IP1]|uniref:hypothetical protein n=1 Tax=Entamoeba invadens IP1 TaxID=370355 RepID=UPI0002C3EADC|nr:hypothetical protein EIN_026790 [Entamoeba invadens IP1]ELP90800.1 hypothetical protein EIN_026790 [Entamoeba invadens IP1]|eukprot:XP_004257571.1 hypothetical protein EIN_026790 [Entamoeba invadens IP1]